MNELLVKTEIFELSLIYNDWTIKKLNNNTKLISRVLFPLQGRDDYKEIKTDAMSESSVKVEVLESKKRICSNAKQGKQLF
jgi:hypothetical protein